MIIIYYVAGGPQPQFQATTRVSPLNDKGGKGERAWDRGWVALIKQTDQKRLVFITGKYRSLFSEKQNLMVEMDFVHPLFEGKNLSHCCKISLEKKAKSLGHNTSQ